MTAAASYFVARLGRALYVRAQGLANMKSAPVLDAFLDGELPHIGTVLVDLSECRGMDSTFMGLLVGYAKLLEGQNARLVIINPSSQNMRLLRMLGVDVVVPILEGHSLPGVDFLELQSDPDLTPSARIELVHRAHQQLIRINAENAARFQPFLTALEADLERARRANNAAR